MKCARRYLGKYLLLLLSELPENNNSTVFGQVHNNTITNK